MSIFIKYPPNGDATWKKPKSSSGTCANGHTVSAEWEPCTIGIEKEYFNAVREIRTCKSSFNDTGNPLYALEAFRLATSVKLYPPLWVIEFLNSRFNHAHSNNLTLDRAFGFSTEGLGKGKSTTPKTSAKLRVRNQLFCIFIFKLEAAGLTRFAACKALSSLLARLPDGEKLSPFPKAEWRGSLYRMDMTGKGIGKAVRDNEEFSREFQEAIKEEAKSWTDSEKTKLLSIFYPSELPVTR